MDSTSSTSSRRTSTFSGESKSSRASTSFTSSRSSGIGRLSTVLKFTPINSSESSNSSESYKRGSRIICPKLSDTFLKQISEPLRKKFVEFYASKLSHEFEPTTVVYRNFLATLPKKEEKKK